MLITSKKATFHGYKWRVSQKYLGNTLKTTSGSERDRRCKYRKG